MRYRFTSEPVRRGWRGQVHDLVTGRRRFQVTRRTPELLNSEVVRLCLLLGIPPHEVEN